MQSKPQAKIATNTPANHAATKTERVSEFNIKEPPVQQPNLQNMLTVILSEEISTEHKTDQLLRMTKRANREKGYQATIARKPNPDETKQRDATPRSKIKEPAPPPNLQDMMSVIASEDSSLQDKTDQLLYLVQKSTIGCHQAKGSSAPDLGKELGESRADT